MTERNKARPLKKTKTRVREPVQQRSIEKKNRIMEASMKLFAEQGIHRTTSKEISAEANVSIGSFYSYFPDKHKLLIDVLGIYLKDHFERIWNNEIDAEPTSLKQTVIFLLENLLDAYDVAPDFHRETHVLRYSDPDVKALYDTWAKRDLDQISSVLTKFADRLRFDDLEATAVVVHSTAENLAHKIKFMGTLDSRRLVEEFAKMLSRYLSL